MIFHSSCLQVLAVAYLIILVCAELGNNYQAVIDIDTLHPGAVLYHGNYFEEAHSAVSPPTLQTQNGTYAGVYSSWYDQDFFLGVPYAQPPVGDLRWRLPRSLNQSFSGTRKAMVYSPNCIGLGGDSWGYPLSEDCLYLNVVRPHRPMGLGFKDPTQCQEPKDPTKPMGPQLTAKASYGLGGPCIDHVLIFVLIYNIF
ncbi:Alpha/Beta hydrolase protein [Xylaria sp. FL1042]|nr:Alpha/Beta hydrolase protein [Xylaria sp. FL1042]